MQVDGHAAPTPDDAPSVVPQRDSGSAAEAGHISFGYRPEVDGLRALAVVPVVLFHAGFGTFSGGYIGVDVFFVISGYLITSIIVQEMHAGRFTITGFYERRARRILPALFLVMLACLPFAWLWMTPRDLKGFAQSVVAATLFVPNVYFFRKSGYFDLDAEETPLLHTWSLGVEEQFYILFPLFVLLCWRWGTRTLTLVLIGVAVASLCLSEWASYAHPVGNFLLAPTRAWELSLGALLAVASLNGFPGQRVGVMVRTTLATLGLGLIVVPIFMYDPTTRYPGVHALAPTLGTALVIVFAQGDGPVARWLGSKWVVAMGLISYSVYLWHQPLFAFARLHDADGSTPLLLGALALLSVALGYLTWRFIESAARDRRRFSRREVFAAAVVASLFLIAVGVAGDLAQGFPARLTPGQQAIMAFADDPRNHVDGFPGKDCFLRPEQYGTAFGECTEGPAVPIESVLLWGDSHAAHLYSGLRSRLPPGTRLTTLTAGACPPLLDYGRPSCRTVSETILARVAQQRPDRVILAAVWGNYDWTSLGRTLQALQQAGVQRIEVVGPVPHWRPSLPVVLIRNGTAMAETPSRVKRGMDPGVARLDVEMKAFAEQRGARYLSPYSILCNVDGCLTRIGDRPEAMLQWDMSHLTLAGSGYLASHMW
jgi:peptidoglycan/LPS O-acetylase OafA/YrhL